MSKVQSILGYIVITALLCYTTFMFLDELTACKGYYTANGYVNNCGEK